jgi:hypothetical protein
VRERSKLVSTNFNIKLILKKSYIMIPKNLTLPCRGMMMFHRQQQNIITGCTTTTRYYYNNNFISKHYRLLPHCVTYGQTLCNNNHYSSSNNISQHQQQQQYRFLTSTNRTDPDRCHLNVVYRYITKKTIQMC